MKDQAVKKGLFHFLNRNYCVSSHLVERLDELKDLPLFLESQSVIVETIRLLELRHRQMELVFAQINLENDFNDCASVISLLEELFTVILLTDNKTPHLSLLDYLSLSDVLLVQSSGMAELAFVQLPLLNHSEYFSYREETLEPLKKLLESRLFIKQ